MEESPQASLENEDARLIGKIRRPTMVAVAAAACIPGVRPLPLLGHSPLGARAQDRRRSALKANRSQPPRRLAADTFQAKSGISSRDQKAPHVWFQPSPGDQEQ